MRNTPKILLLEISSLLITLRPLGGECSLDESPKVNLTQGVVAGYSFKTVLGRDIYGFRGLPYAAPPVGDLRFKAPQPPSAWEGVRRAADEPPACIQPWRKVEFPIYYSEDCLFLNVFTPYLQPPDGKLMPVMVWIHGGKFYQGSGATHKYGPDFFMMKDVVLVNINYRLGVFGHLNMNVSEAQGNAAMKDKVAALKWVKKEIHKFGGNPNLVTILGGSSGAAAVNFIYLSPMGKGLFHRAVSLSGFVCDNGILPASASVNFGLRLAKALGCPSQEPEAVVACLRDINATELAEKQMIFKGEDGRDTPFYPSVETALGEEVFLEAPLHSLLDQLSPSSTPLILSLTSGEGLLYVDNPNKNPDQFKNVSESLKEKLLLDTLQKSQPKNLQDVVEKAKNLYIGNKTSIADKIYGFLDFLIDNQYIACTLKTVMTMSRKIPVYLLYFTFYGEFQNKNLAYQLLNLTGKVCHGEDLSYTFYRNYTIREHNNIANHSEEMSFVKNLVNMWTNFSTYGNPAEEKYSNLSLKPVEGNFTRHLIIGSSYQVAEYPLFKERMDFWNYLDKLL